MTCRPPRSDYSDESPLLAVQKCLAQFDNMRMHMDGFKSAYPHHYPKPKDVVSLVFWHNANIWSKGKGVGPCVPAVAFPKHYRKMFKLFNRLYYEAVETKHYSLENLLQKRTFLTPEELMDFCRGFLKKVVTDFALCTFRSEQTAGYGRAFRGWIARQFWRLRMRQHPGRWLAHHCSVNVFASAPGASLPWVGNDGGAPRALWQEVTAWDLHMPELFEDLTEDALTDEADPTGLQQKVKTEPFEAFPVLLEKVYRAGIERFSSTSIFSELTMLLAEKVFLCVVNYIKHHFSAIAYLYLQRTSCSVCFGQEQQQQPPPKPVNQLAAAPAPPSTG